MNQQIMQCINVVCSVLRTVWFLNLSHVTKVSVFDIEDITSTKRMNISSAACKVLYRFHTGTFDRDLARSGSKFSIVIDSFAQAVERSQSRSRNSISIGLDRALKRPVSRCNYASLFVVHVR